MNKNIMKKGFLKTYHKNGEPKTDEELYKEHDILSTIIGIFFLSGFVGILILISLHNF